MITKDDITVMNEVSIQHNKTMFTAKLIEDSYMLIDNDVLISDPGTFAYIQNNVKDYMMDRIYGDLLKDLELVLQCANHYLDAKSMDRDGIDNCCGLTKVIDKLKGIL